MSNQNYMKKIIFQKYLFTIWLKKLNIYECIVFFYFFKDYKIKNSNVLLLGNNFVQMSLRDKFHEDFNLNIKWLWINIGDNKY